MHNTIEISSAKGLFANHLVSISVVALGSSGACAVLLVQNPTPYNILEKNMENLSFFCSQRLHLFDWKYSKHSKIVKYYYNLK